MARRLKWARLSRHSNFYNLSKELRPAALSLKACTEFKDVCSNTLTATLISTVGQVSAQHTRAIIIASVLVIVIVVLGLVKAVLVLTKPFINC
jgi:hypothetical protein